MADHQLSKLLESQISLTEWLARINHDDAKVLREEDNIKRQRLGEIGEIIELPYDKPTTFPAEDVAKRTPEFNKFLEEHGGELCALRLIPKKGQHVEKLRNRGKSISQAVGWFDGLNIDPAQYDADFVPHINDYSWATIFVVNNKGIFGEIYKGGHHILTQGLYEGAAPIVFGYDFKTKQWQTSPQNKAAETYLKGMTSYIHVADNSTQSKLNKKVGAEFANDYIKGYFETTDSKEVGTWFIDYNRMLGQRYEDYVLDDQPKTSARLVQGRTACQGRVEGTVKIINDPADAYITANDILVCSMTTPDYIPLMIKAKGIITDKGGILCHAAIVARELKKPCIVGTGNATKLLKNGDLITLDATAGTVVRK